MPLKVRARRRLEQVLAARFHRPARCPHAVRQRLPEADQLAERADSASRRRAGTPGAGAPITDQKWTDPRMTCSDPGLEVWMNIRRLGARMLLIVLNGSVLAVLELKL